MFKQKDNKRRKLLIILLVLTGLLSFAILSYFIFCIIGKNQFQTGAILSSAADDLEVEVSTGEDASEETDAETSDDYSVCYEGKEYVFNDDIICILFIGVDTDDPLEANEFMGNGGQADTLILAVFDTETDEVTLISIDRNTMTEIQRLDLYGDSAGYTTAQITLAYAQGDGAEKSCEITATAVSELFYDLPINAYCAVSMGAITYINDAVGGVEITVTEDIAQYYPDTEIGSAVLLEGKDALTYLRYRMNVGDGTNEERLERQTEYILNFLTKARQRLEKDVTLPLNIYNSINEYVVTTITVQQITYLSSAVLKMSISDEILTLEGETVEGKNFDEFYHDEDELYKLVLEAFYVCLDE